MCEKRNALFKNGCIPICGTAMEGLSNDHNNWLYKYKADIDDGLQAKIEGFYIHERTELLHCKDFGCTEKPEDPLPRGVLRQGKWGRMICKRDHESQVNDAVRPNRKFYSRREVGARGRTVPFP